jgi:ABC-type lipoprotein export system ATPase subunit
MRLQFSSVHKTYEGARGEVRAVSDVSFSLDSGQFIAIQGPSGCGKSTLLLVAGGLLRPESGTVTHDDSDIYELSPEGRADFRAENVGFVFQQFHLVPYLTVLDNVLAAAHAARNGHIEFRNRAAELLERFGLSGRMEHRPAELSTGERQRTALARALLNRPTILLADEPTGNLDEENAAIVLDQLSEFSSAGGAVLLVTHDRAAAGRAQQTLVMDAGRFVTSQVGSGAS